MSTTTSPPSPDAPKTVRDQIIADAQDVPTLIAAARQLDPDLAQQFEGKALLASKTPWGTLLGGLIAWAAARYGIGWDPGTCALLGGVGVLLASYVIRYVTKAPIVGVVSKPSG